MTNVDEENLSLNFDGSRPGRISVDEGVISFLPTDKVVAILSREKNRSSPLPDAGANRFRLSRLREAAGLDQMGQDRGSADSSTEMGETGVQTVTNQLKAFYGLQKGTGFEEVLAE